jgi:GNAT superfamily N-acetyltransferase
MESALNFIFSSTDLNAVRLLRDSVLRPGLPRGKSVYAGDDEPDTLHVGAFLADKVVAVASVCHESPPGENDPVAWRVRGVATLPKYQGQGLAQRLLNRCIAYAVAQGGRRVWCTARLSVAKFYRTCGFAAVGETFVLPQYSDERYVRMEYSEKAF